MGRLTPFCLATLIWLFAPVPLRSQAMEIPKASGLRLVVRDTLADSTVSAEANVRMEGRPARRARGKDLRIGLYPSGRIVVDLRCWPVPGEFGAGAIMHRDTIEFDARQPGEQLHTIRTDMRVCVFPAEQAIPLEIDGHVFIGFESNYFAPCGSVPLPPRGGYSEQRNSINARFIVDSIGKATLDSLYLGTDGDHAHWFGRWRGTLRGPGHFGHFGISPYGFEIVGARRVLTGSGSRATDCARR